MVFTRKTIRNLLALALFLGITFALTNCATAPDLPYYQKSAQPNTFDYQSDAPFTQYIAETKAYLQQNRVFQNASEQAQELAMVAPFEWQPDAACTAKHKRGILLIHGLSDTTFVMRDLAAALSQRCILVRSLLLPGHGTRPKDLADIAYSDWVAAVDYGLRSLKQEVEHAFIAGFSLGGLLSANALLDHTDLQGAVLIAPALGVNMPLLTWNTTWLRHIKDWADVDPPTQAPRYQSMTMNGLAQTYLLTQHFNERLQQQGAITTPVLLIQSMADIAVQPQLNLDLFQQKMTHPNSSALIYSSEPAALAKFPGLQAVNSYLPAQRIVNFSHLALPYAPDNAIYGAQGSYKACGLHVGPVSDKQASDCLQGDNNWLGEFGSEDETKFYPFQRLTFNPLFDAMVTHIEGHLQQ